MNSFSDIKLKSDLTLFQTDSEHINPICEKDAGEIDTQNGNNLLTICLRLN